MKRIGKRIAAAGLALALVLALTACGGGGVSTDSATLLIRATWTSSIWASSTPTT